MIQLTRKARFSAAHRYYRREWTAEENQRRFGLCSLPHGHGHDYVLEATLAGEVDPATGMVVNISDLKAILEQTVLARLDGEYLTPEHEVLAGLMPTAEVLVTWIGKTISTALAARGLPARLSGVRLWESSRLRAECTARGERWMVTLTRTYEFAAAHRLHSPVLSDDENRRIFAKCNNPHGHGHNYVLEVTVGGEPDPRTGMLLDLGLLDQVVTAEVVDRYDHRHLNLDTPEFRDLNPTSENLVRVIWDRLEPALPPGSLHRISVRETDRNVFAYERTTG